MLITWVIEGSSHNSAGPLLRRNYQLFFLPRSPALRNKAIMHLILAPGDSGRPPRTLFNKLKVRLQLYHVWNQIKWIYCSVRLQFIDEDDDEVHTVVPHAKSDNDDDVSSSFFFFIDHRMTDSVSFRAVMTVMKVAPRVATVYIWIQYIYEWNLS